MLSREEIKEHIEHILGVKVAHHVKYANRYDTSGYSFYIKSVRTRPLVIHPELRSNLEKVPINGVELKNLYHNSALNTFPRLDLSREPCG